ncbi:MAG: disulfide oxidoreductase [Alphaproteobacteria bacterium]|nr:disulfide oxidoreductase [Alphaproteobacteria bacterium]MDX5369773.1 disulfide oxidoreductase [Alphaproteobacteria bacterium]MDX5464397.1 disulfide oxidoreductase [Alphaproteobacteria bacterium]
MSRIQPSTSPLPGRATAVLGPTNTGKTHFALERMMAHRSGMIGLPLRLLAREVYDKVVRVKGPAAVALVTGEEKIVPAHPSYWVCTVESMPVGLPVEFLAVDEVQLATDAERGHVFTDRILRARGTAETMLMGSETMRPVLRALLPEAQFVSRPRFSELSYAGGKKLSRLPRRTAIVAFSANEVYAIAELIRRQRGGAAVVMGALSPRTRNAQVALYESGEVDFLVATDAIGMGLNMDVSHVAFAATEKFDGRTTRPLAAPEMAQIAGRAGRHMSDGTFGVTGSAGEPDPEIVAQIEDHRFDPVRVLQWRNSHLAPASLDALIAGLEVPSGHPMLARGREAGDLLVLKQLARDPEVRRLAGGPAAVLRLWDVAQVPDFRKTLSGDHVGLLKRVFGYLMSDRGTLPEDWVAGHVARLDRTEGDIDTLAARIAHTRVWTYISNRPNWLDDPRHWQGRTREIEDRLSDALHERLTHRFIDRRTSVLMRRLRQREELMASVSDQGEVHVEGEHVGRLDGFVFTADPKAGGAEGKALRAAAASALGPALAARVDALCAAEDKALDFTEQAGVTWDGRLIARMKATGDVLSPAVEPFVDEHMPADAREKLVRHLDDWMRRQARGLLGPLFDLREASDLDGLTRGLAFQLVESLGLLDRAAVGETVKQLSQEDRGKLRARGVRFAEYSIYVPALLKPAPTRLKLYLWALDKGLGEVPPAPPPGLVTVPVDPEMPEGYYGVAGFRVCGPLAARIDMTERLADALRPLTRRGPENPEGSFEANADLMSLVGRSGEEFAAILRSLGYQAQTVTDDMGQSKTLWRRKGPGRPRGRKPEGQAGAEGPGQSRDEGEGRAPRPPRGGKGPHKGKPRGKPHGQKPGAHAGPGGAVPQKSGGGRPRREEKPVDPDSPFAALADLKAALTRRS